MEIKVGMLLAAAALLALATAACKRPDLSARHELVVRSVTKDARTGWVAYGLQSVEYPPLYYDGTVTSCRVDDPISGSQWVEGAYSCPDLGVGRHVMTYLTDGGVYDGGIRTKFEMTIAVSARTYILEAVVTPNSGSAAQRRSEAGENPPSLP